MMHTLLLRFQGERIKQPLLAQGMATGHFAWILPSLAPSPSWPLLLYPPSLFNFSTPRCYPARLSTTLMTWQTSYLPSKYRNLNPSWCFSLHCSYRWIQELITQQLECSSKGFEKFNWNNGESLFFGKNTDMSKNSFS